MNFSFSGWIRKRLFEDCETILSISIIGLRLSVFVNSFNPFFRSLMDGNIQLIVKIRRILCSDLLNLAFSFIPSVPHKFFLCILISLKYNRNRRIRRQEGIKYFSSRLIDRFLTLENQIYFAFEYQIFLKYFFSLSKILKQF